MGEVIDAILKDLSQDDIEGAIRKLQGSSRAENFKVIFVPIAQQFNALCKGYRKGLINQDGYKIGRSEILQKILSELESPEIRGVINQEIPETPETEQLVKSIEDITTDGPPQAGKINKSMDTTRDRLLELSLHLEFFDWSQRDYLGKLGALLLQVDQHLRLLPQGNALMSLPKPIRSSDKQLLQLLHTVSSQNNQTRTYVFNLLTSDLEDPKTFDSEDLLIQTKNVELPKLAMQLETLVDRLAEE